MWYHKLGQIIGYLAPLAFIISYQAKDKKRLLFFQTTAVVLLCVHYALIEAWSGLALNIVCLARNYVFSNPHKTFRYKVWPYIFAVLITVVGLLSWESWYSIFLIVALAFNTIFLAQPNANVVRASILFSSPLILTYNVFVGSVGGIINESVSILSAIIGLIRHGQKQRKEE